MRSETKFELSTRSRTCTAQTESGLRQKAVSAMDKSLEIIDTGVEDFHCSPIVYNVAILYRFKMCIKPNVKLEIKNGGFVLGY